mmetsp:Transcript_23771/g.54981  ORF Transcript_23771/g.54981 Transcript_23771/m.54981 type:complete len:193 (+) Transcript_23771:1152-1730(+)
MELAPQAGPAGTVARLAFLLSRYPADALRWLGMGVLSPQNASRVDQLGGESGPVPLGGALFVESHAIWCTMCLRQCYRADIIALHLTLKPPSWIKKDRAILSRHLWANALAETYGKEYGLLVRELARICRPDRVLCLVGQMPSFPMSRHAVRGLNEKMLSAADALVRPLAVRLAERRQHTCSHLAPGAHGAS